MIQSQLRGRGLTWVEVLAVVVLVVVVLAVLIPVISSMLRTERGPNHSHHLRGIHQSMVIYAQGNKFYYAGLDLQGNPLPNSQSATGNSGEGTTVEACYWILLKHDFLTPGYVVSPSETDSSIVEYDPGKDDPLPITRFNYSYAMLDIDAPGQRLAEWKETANTQAVVLADRNTGSTDAPSSIHFKTHEAWKGYVGWNDNHVDFEQKPTVETKYSNSVVFPDDYIFAAESGDDAYLIHSGK